MTIGFTSSLDGGATWTPGYRIGRPMKAPWIANTNQGYMVGRLDLVVIHRRWQGAPGLLARQPLRAN